MSNAGKPQKDTSAAQCGDAGVPSHLNDEIAAIWTELREIKRLLLNSARNDAYGFLDARAAAAYCAMSRGTFDKYRYSTGVKLKGYRLDGKVLYKRNELDSFIQLYEIKSAGLR